MAPERLSSSATRVLFDMKLAVALFKENEKHPEQRISMPKLKAREKEPKSKIQKITNLNTAISLFKTAGVSMRGISAENFHDHEDKDKAVIMGCIFTIILDYAARGFGAGSSSEVKRALLQWVNKKTDGYAQVNPPGVKNFTKDWRNGLAWCALIHRHRPDLLDYQECLGKSNAENLALAFTVADEQLGIPRLLDVEDMDVDSPDEKSVITYTMEYFLRFANAGLREQAAKQAADWLSFLREIKDLQHDYERRARRMDVELCGTPADADEPGPVQRRLRDLGPVVPLVVGAFSELSEFAERLLKYVAEAGSVKHWSSMRCESPLQCLQLILPMLRRSWGMAAFRSNARQLIDRLHLADAPSHTVPTARLHVRRGMQRRRDSAIDHCAVPPGY